MEIRKGIFGEIYLPRFIFSDSRGILVKFIYDGLKAGELEQFEAREIFYSVSKYGALRGIHNPLFPGDSWRIFGVTTGRTFDVLIDLREKSQTRGQIVTNELNDTGPIVAIPKGIGHGFQSLIEDTQMLYIFGVDYHVTREGGINPFSPGISWPIPPQYVSDKDNYLPFCDFLNPNYD